MLFCSRQQLLTSFAFQGNQELTLLCAHYLGFSQVDEDTIGPPRVKARDALGANVCCLQLGINLPEYSTWETTKFQLCGFC
jgi:hypothetical protein